RRQRPARADPRRARLPGAVRGADPPRGVDRDGGGRDDHRRETGGRNHPARASRPDPAGPRIPARTELAAARGERTGRAGSAAAGAVRAGVVSPIVLQEATERTEPGASLSVSSVSSYKNPYGKGLAWRRTFQRPNCSRR